MKIIMRLLEERDIPLMISSISDKDQRTRRRQIFERYLNEQDNGEREVIVAFSDEEYVGHVTIIWHPEYPPFAGKNIPEISDIGVEPELRRRGIGSMLMDEAEKRIFRKSEIAGIGFGISADYGPAQRMFVKRGYVPDGKGLWTSERGYIWEFSTVQVDDCVIFLTKNRKFDD
jgi:GNAT superfamily N-acetyltransferase